MNRGDVDEPVRCCAETAGNGQTPCLAVTCSRSKLPINEYLVGANPWQQQEEQVNTMLWVYNRHPHCYTHSLRIVPCWVKGMDRSQSKCVRRGGACWKSSSRQNSCQQRMKRGLQYVGESLSAHNISDRWGAPPHS